MSMPTANIINYIIDCPYLQLRQRFSYAGLACDIEVFDFVLRKLMGKKVHSCIFNNIIQEL